MEVSFLSSNTLTVAATRTSKTHQVTALINQFKPFTCRKTSVTRSYKINRQAKNLRICCELGSFSSNRDDDFNEVEDEPMINRDWRSFRARLIAAEHAPKSTQDDQSAAPIDPDRPLDNDHPQTISIGDKWAHMIHEPEKGCLLIATKKLDGDNIFERTVVLLLENSPIGPTGIILNRPSLMSIKEAKSPAMDLSETFSNRPLFFGGPLRGGIFLINGPIQGDDFAFEEVMKGLYYGRRESLGIAPEIVKKNVVGLDDIRFFDGYCGWGKEQLQDEIKSGCWTLAACSPSVIGLGSVESSGLWEEVLGLIFPKMLL
ncbi:hypothetical protein Droror1_Dr00020002 [Drosera rotundifolia]